MEIEGPVEEVLRRRAKAVLRQRARALRNTIPAAALANRSAKIIDGLVRLPVLQAQGPVAVALFYPIEGRNEVDLRPLDAVLRGRGARVAYPSIDPETRIMTFRFVSNPETMEERGLGFREPREGDEEAERLDLVVVPALQIDPRGHRIGYGAGFYDRALPRFAPPAIKAGVAYDFQLISEVPITEGDIALDVVITDARTIEVGSAI